MPRLRFRPFLVALALCALAAEAGAAPPPTATVEAATGLIDSWSGRPEPLIAARAKLDEALRADPNDVQALKQQARLVIRAGYINERKVTFRAHTYSVGNYRPGTLETAEATIRKALAIDPLFADGYVLLGHVQTEQRKLQDAAQSLAKAESMGTSDPWLHLNWASIHVAMGEYAAAAERWQRVLATPGLAANIRSAVRAHVIEDHLRAGRHEEASAVYRQQIADDPASAWTRGNYASHLSTRLGRHDEAIQQAREALAIMDYGVGRRILAMALYNKWAELALAGKDAEADVYFREAHGTLPGLHTVMAQGGAQPSGEPLAKALSAKKGVPVDARDNGGSTALLLAVNTNRKEPVRFLLALKANPNVVDHNGWTPLLSAADEGNEEIARLLLAAGADRKATMDGRDAAMIAERHGLYALAREIRGLPPANR